MLVKENSRCSGDLVRMLKSALNGRNVVIGLTACCLTMSIPAQATHLLNHTAADVGADDQVAREAISSRVEKLLKSEDFAALNTMADDFRTTRARTPSGVWKLRVLHMSIRNYIAESQSGEGCVSAAHPMLKRWMEFTPAAPLPPISEANALLEQAWCKRYDSAWGTNAFLADAGEAEQMLATHKTSAAIDPEFFATAEDVAFVTKPDKADFKRLLDEGVAREPGYYGLYFSAMKYYVSHAYGSTREVDDLARFAAEKTASTDGAGAYARVYWAYLDCGCALWGSSIDWPLMKRSMAEVVDHYHSDWNIVTFAKISCRMRDPLEAAKYFRQVRHDNGLAWDNSEDRSRCRKFAGFGGKKAPR